MTREELEDALVTIFSSPYTSIREQVQIALRMIEEYGNVKLGSKEDK